LSAVLLSLAGCASRDQLVARNGEHRLTAFAPELDLTVVLTTNAWSGAPAALDDELTVVHALVANMGSQPILLAPGDLELRDLRGFRYPLLDAGASFATVQTAAGDSQSPAGYDPGGPHRFGAIEPFGDIPAHALPWGILQPGTQMRGFLYFESLAPSANGGVLTWHITDPAHRPLVDLRFELFLAKR
jgi:hypothetical protein